MDELIRNGLAPLGRIDLTEKETQRMDGLARQELEVLLNRLRISLSVSLDDPPQKLDGSGARGSLEDSPDSENLFILQMATAFLTSP